MRKYTKEDFLKAAELGEVSMIDAKHIVSLLDEVKITTRKEYQKQYQKDYAASGKKKEAQKKVLREAQIRDLQTIERKKSKTL